MRKLRNLWLVLGCLAVLGAGTVQAEEMAAPGPTDIVDTSVAAGSFKTLAKALEVAGLVDTLKGKGPFTVFAPTDKAFEALPAGTLDALLKDVPKLKAILLYHVVAGQVMAADAIKLDGKSAATVGGPMLPIKVVDGKVMVCGATVTTADIKCGNGVIHVIDKVLLPPKE
jgi:uncharacterized surface protein with fasciclin (FAS1) repeats